MKVVDPQFAMSKPRIHPLLVCTGVWPMLEGPKVFVDVDTQRDFLEPTGALYVPCTTAIVSRLARLTRFALDQQIPVLATACAHTPYDPELEFFPPHCMVGTPGQKRVDATRCDESVAFDENAQVPTKAPRHLTLLKRQYDLFSHPRADELITLYAVGQPVFVVYGVATDYCVTAAVRGLLARQLRIAIVVDAIRAIDNAAEVPILTEFARRGVLLTLTDIVCNLESQVPVDPVL
jgi:nicotinamidase/pyrazinamidase